MELLPSDQGADLDGDGEIDNKLPDVLNTVDALVTAQDLTKTGINEALAAGLGDDTLVVLIDAEHDDPDLRVDVLLGTVDEDTDALGVDEQSYGEDGAPTSRLSGWFESQEEFTASADYILIPVTFYPDEPPLFIPLAIAVMEGELTAARCDGTLVGAAPVDDVIELVVEPLIPTGDDYDKSKYLNQERDEFIEGIRDLANENMADIELEDGSMAFSAALSFGSQDDSW